MQAGLYLTWSETREDTLSRDMAHMYIKKGFTFPTRIFSLNSNELSLPDGTMFCTFFVLTLAIILPSRTLEREIFFAQRNYFSNLGSLDLWNSTFQFSVLDMRKLCLAVLVTFLYWRIVRTDEDLEVDQHYQSCKSFVVIVKLLKIRTSEKVTVIILKTD